MLSLDASHVCDENINPSNDGWKCINAECLHVPVFAKWKSIYILCLSRLEVDVLLLSRLGVGLDFLAALNEVSNSRRKHLSLPFSRRMDSIVLRFDLWQIPTHSARLPFLRRRSSRGKQSKVENRLPKCTLNFLHYGANFGGEKCWGNARDKASQGGKNPIQS